jgi:hypothetical protein
MRRFSALVMLLGAVTAMLGVFGIVGIEKINLPPAAARVIADALPTMVLVVGVLLLIFGAFAARLATREAELRRSVAGDPAKAAALDAGAPAAHQPRPATGAKATRAGTQDRAT